MGVYFWDNQILFENDKVAFHENCCCDSDAVIVPGDECGGCADVDTTPPAVRVTISGVTDANCGYCHVFNGLHRLAQGPGVCQWNIDLPDNPLVCSVEIAAELAFISPNYRLLVSLQSNRPGAYNEGLYQKTWPNRPVCIDWNNEVLSFIGESGIPTGNCADYPPTILLSASN